MGIREHSFSWRPAPNTLVAIALCFLPGCSSTSGPVPVSSSPETRVEELQVVDCLLPGKVRHLGKTPYVTPRLPTRTTASDCAIRGGEFTAYDRADYKTALRIWMPNAEAGDAEAQANVGEIFERGLGGAANYEAAVIWYERAAKQGNARAQFNLGTLYEQGLGVDKNPLQALNWYRKAWGLEEDNVIYQSASNHEVEKLRSELTDTLRQREVRITRLEKQLQQLQAKSTGAGPDAAALNEEIQDLHAWIDSMESDRKTTEAQLNELPSLRQPDAQQMAENTAVPAKSISSGNIDFGKYYALVIGNQRYTNMGNLETPENDVRDIAKLLSDKYGFSVQVLVDSDNIRVMEAINNLDERLGDNDNLLIYYAGHGARLQTGEHESGYWLPVNADAPPRDTYWVPNEFVTRHLSRLKAKRVMVVADSCYAGLLSDAPGYLMLQDGPKYNEEFLRYKLPKRSRLLLSSGGDKPVLDNGAPGHSVFAAVLLDTLRENDRILSGPELYTAIDSEVTRRAARTGFTQKAEYKVIKGAGHEVGDFFFVPQ